MESGLSTKFAYVTQRYVVYHFQLEAFLKKCGDLHVWCQQFTHLYPNFPWVPSPPYQGMLLTNFEYHSGCNGPNRITRRTGIQPTIT